MFCFTLFDRIIVGSPGGPRTCIQQSDLKMIEFLLSLIHCCWHGRCKTQHLARKLIKSTGQGNVHLTEDDWRSSKGGKILILVGERERYWRGFNYYLQMGTLDFLGNIFINIFAYVHYTPHAKIYSVI